MMPWAGILRKKTLLTPNNTRRYYYNYNWQVLCDANSADVLQNYYVYGNYIDEILMANGCSDTIGLTKFYAKDLLFRPGGFKLSPPSV